MIEAAQLQLPQDSLTTAIDTAGVYYRVPIYCISDPDNYNVDNVMEAMRNKKAPKEKQYKVSYHSPFRSGLLASKFPLRFKSAAEIQKNCRLTRHFRLDRCAKFASWKPDYSVVKLEHYSQAQGELPRSAASRQGTRPCHEQD